MYHDPGATSKKKKESFSFPGVFNRDRSTHREVISGTVDRLRGKEGERYIAPIYMYV